jgi:hypothetical protein
MSELLSRITTGAVERPVSLIVHGGPGVGKSTFAAGAPDPLFIDCDNRTAHLDVKRIAPTGWEDILEIFRLVARGELPCKTIVIDTLDHAEMLLWAHLVAVAGVTTIEEVGGGYGKGYIAALGEWRRLAAGMDAVRARGVNVVMLAHSADKGHKNAVGEDYARIEVALDKRATGFLSQRVDAIGYAAFDTVVVKNKEGRAKAKTSGNTTLSFKPSAAVATKRFARFPEACALTWEALMAGPK